MVVLVVVTAVKTLRRLFSQPGKQLEDADRSWLACDRPGLGPGVGVGDCGSVTVQESDQGGAAGWELGRDGQSARARMWIWPSERKA